MPLLWHRSSMGHSSLQGVPATGWSASLQDCVSPFHVSPPLPPPPPSPHRSPHVSSSVSCPRGCCSFLNTLEQRCHVLLSLVEVLAYGGLFSSLSKLAESSCDWHSGVHVLLPCGPLQLKACQLCPIHSCHDMHFQIRPDPFFFSKV